MLRRPAARADAGAFRQERGCSLGAEVKRAVPLLQNETQNMNTTENLIATGCPTAALQPQNKIVKPIKFPPQPQEWKIVSLRECPTPDTMQQCETPDQAAAYWRTHIATHPYFNSECECLVVFILNTRRRIKGHYLVSIGTMDTILCHPREVFRLAIMASAAAIINFSKSKFLTTSSSGIRRIHHCDHWASSILNSGRREPPFYRIGAGSVDGLPSL